VLRLTTAQKMTLADCAASTSRKQQRRVEGFEKVTR
jgi:hypothetical protein